LGCAGSQVSAGVTFFADLSVNIFFGARSWGQCCDDLEDTLPWLRRYGTNDDPDFLTNTVDRLGQLDMTRAGEPSSCRYTFAHTHILCRQTENKEGCIFSGTGF